MTIEKAVAGAALVGVSLLVVTLGGCGALVLGFAGTVREEAPPLPAPLEADYRQVGAERGIEWELLAAWDGAVNGFQLPVPTQASILADLVEQALERKRAQGQRLCDSDPNYCAPPEPVLSSEEMDRLAQAAYRKWHGLVWEYIGSHAD